jgi:hypothetical protein
VTIDQLEGRLRRMAIAMIALFCGLAIIVGFNAAVAFHKLGQVRDQMVRLRAELAEGIRSRDVLVVDGQGEVRGRLTASDGGGLLTLWDRCGRPRLQAEAGRAAPALNLRDEIGQAKVSLALDPHGGGVLLRSPNPRSAAALQVIVGTTGPRLRLLGDDGQEVGLMP